MKNLRVILMASDEIALPVCQAVHNHYTVVAVYTQPPRQKNRGHKYTETPIHQWAKTQDIPVEIPVSLKNTEVMQTFSAYRADCVVLMAYGLILPQAFLDVYPEKFLNIHPSLLPHWRGASPIVYPILHGDTWTGISIMIMTAGMDEGPVLAQLRIPLPLNTTRPVLQSLLAERSADLLIDALPAYIKGYLQAKKQDHTQATYTKKLVKTDGLLDFDGEEAAVLLRKVQAFDPWPGTYFFHNKVRIKVLSACISSDIVPKDVPHTDVTLGIPCKTGYFFPLDVIPEGKKSTTWKQYCTNLS